MPLGSNPDINSDLVEDVGTDIPTPIPSTEVPESAPGVWTPFEPDEVEPNDALFMPDESAEQASFKPVVTAAHRPVASSLLAIAMSDPAVTNDITLLNDANLQAARDLLDQSQEYAARVRVATDRQVDTLKYLDNLKTQWQERARAGETVPAGVQELIGNTYDGVMNADREKDARTAVEFEAIDRIRDYVERNDVHEAYLLRDQMFSDSGTAEKVIREEATKSLIALQRLEELEAEYQDSGWIRGFFNGLIRAVPMLDSFSAAGILDDAGIANGAGGLMDFILRGDNLVDQRESLFALPLDQFSEAMAPDGELMKSIRANADWLMADPARASEVASILLAGTQPSPAVENVFGAVDVAFLGAGSAGRMTKVLKGLGARSAAVDQTTRAALETIRRGPEGARAATGMDADELAENLSPNFFATSEGVSIASDVAAKLKVAEELRKIFPDIMATHRATSPEEIRAAMQVYEKEMLEGAMGTHVKDIKFVETDMKTGATKEFADEVAEDGATVYTMEVTLGKKEGGGYAKKAHAEGVLEKVGREGEIFKDPETGSWYAKTQVTIPLDGFISGKLETPDAVLSSLRSSARTADATAHAKGVVAGNAINRFVTQVERTLKASVKGLSGKERQTITQVIKKGQNEAKWYNEDDFILHYERLNGKAPSEKAWQAYETYRSVSDLVYLVRNDVVYMKKVNEGFESHKFRMGGRDVDLDGKLIDDPKKRPAGERIWDASSERWLADNISAKRIQEMADEGYVMLRLDHTEMMPDGRAVRYVMAKRGDVTSRPLRRGQLNYSQGGSRAYDASHFIKQAANDVDGNLINPLTHIAGRNLNEMKAWAATMNEALVLARGGEKDLIKYDDIFKGREGYPTAQEFLDMVDQHHISLKHDFEVVEDATMPSAYFKNADPQALRYVDLDETSLEGLQRSSGQMYYGTKGETLKDVTGKYAETIDPWNTLNSTVMEAANAYSFSGYKTNMVQRFKNTYGAYLDLDNVAQADNLYGLANAAIRRDAPDDIARKARQEQAAVKRLLNFETEFEKRLGDAWQRAGMWVLGDAKETSVRAKTRNAMDWLAENNPVQFMRTLAFDANLGMWNVGQLFIQTSTIASAMALHGSKAMKGLPLIYPLKSWAVSGYRDDVLDVMVKNGMWKGGFKTGEEFKQYMKTMKESGLYEVSGHNMAMVREYGANKIFGASSVYDAVSEKGRMFFYFAEQANRTVASRIAWDELIEAGVKPGTAKFREQFARLTDDYSFNMLSQSSASFQHGLPSIPTQFWAYGFRMMDAMFGKRFTPAQRLRLAVANGAMAGAAGVPGGMLIKDLYEQYTGQPIKIEDGEAWLARGFFDNVAYALTGSDIQIGAKVGTAEQLQNIVKDLFGAGEYGEKSAWDMITGASGAKIASAVPALWDVIWWNGSEITGDAGGLAKDSWLRMAQEIATVKNFSAAFLANRYHVYWSKNGSLVTDEVPESDAFFYALGFQPGAQSEISFYFDAAKDSDIDEASKMLTNWRQDAFTIPDKYEENRQKAMAMMRLFTPSERKKIREKAQKAMSPSMLTTVQTRWEQDMTESEFYDDMSQRINEEEVE